MLQLIGITTQLGFHGFTNALLTNIGSCQNKSGNAWPVLNGDLSGPQTNWLSPPTWESVAYGGANTIFTHIYENEFIGTVSSNSPWTKDCDQTGTMVRWNNIDPTPTGDQGCPNLVTDYSPTKIRQLSSIDTKRKNHILLAPNPNTGSFRLTSNDKISGIKIRSLMGQEMYSLSLPESSDIIIDSKLTSGFYFCEVQTKTEINIIKFSIK